MSRPNHPSHEFHRPDRHRISSDEQCRIGTVDVASGDGVTTVPEQRPDRGVGQPQIGGEAGVGMPEHMGGDIPWQPRDPMNDPGPDPAKSRAHRSAIIMVAAIQRVRRSPLGYRPPPSAGQH